MKIVEEKTIGIASILKIVCQVCDYEFSFSSSKKAQNGIFESNFRLVYGMRCLGKGREAANLLCGMMNMPTPNVRFDSTNKYLSEIITVVAEENMKEGTNKLVEDRKAEISANGLALKKKQLMCVFQSMRLG